MPKKRLTPRKEADRALCPVQTANVIRMKVHEIARWMREADVAEPLIPQNAKKLCRAHTDTCGEVAPELLSDRDVAALRWVGIDPFDHSMRVVHRENCPG